MGQWQSLCALADIPDNAPCGKTAGGKPVALVRRGGTVYAFEDRCSHQDNPLSDGTLRGDQIECSWHEACFDIRTGQAMAMPAIDPIRTYKTEVRDGQVWVELP